MRQRFTYDCVLIKEDDGYCASFPQIPGAFADGDTREEAIAHATEALMAFLADDLNNGLTPAGYERTAEGGRLLVRGKRKKQRCVPLVAGAARALADWLRSRGHEPRFIEWPPRT